MTESPGASPPRDPDPFSRLARKARGLSLRAAQWTLLQSVKSGQVERFEPALSRFLAASSLARPGQAPQADAVLALAYRSRRTHPLFFEALLRSGLYPDARLDHGAALLHDAVAANDSRPDDLRFVQLLLDAGAQPHLPDGNGVAALSIAAARGNPRAAELLLLHNADPNAIDSIGKTPLIHAIPGFSLSMTPARDDREPRELLCSLLLNAGADPNIAPRESQLPLLLAFSAGREALACELIRFGARIEPLLNPQNHLTGVPLDRFYPQALAAQERLGLSATLLNAPELSERAPSKRRFI